ncbi:TPA: arsenate reductase family protein [Streptococcus suis]
MIIKDVTSSEFEKEESEKLTVYYNPDCSKCKKLQVLLPSQDLDIKWVNYLEHPLTEVELAALLEKMDSQPSAVIRLTEEERAGLSEEELFQRLVAEPALLNRPIIEREQTAFLCRPLDIIKKKMPEYDWSAYV